MLKSIGAFVFIRSREVVRFVFIRSREVVRFWEGPLSEAPLYFTDSNYDGNILKPYLPKE